MRKVDEWAFRVQREIDRETTQSVHFVTLTYDNKNVPLTKNGFMTLSKDDVRKYLENLKKYNKRHKYAPVKYFLVGEYGSSKQMGRPHYHAIIFNVTTAERLNTWGKGNVDIGLDVGTNAVGYIADYIFKSSKVPLFERDDRLKEFRFISNGLGSNYLTKDMVDYHRRHFFENSVTLKGGKKIAMPRYFQKKIFDEKERIERAAYIGVIVDQIK